MGRRALSEGKAKDVVIHVRLPRRGAALLQLVADSETGGNRSELNRKLVETKVEERLDGRSRRTGAPLLMEAPS